MITAAALRLAGGRVFGSTHQSLHPALKPIPGRGI
jgi:hypothetical protein